MTIYAQDLMSRDLVTISPAENLATADAAMELGRLRHLPVVKDGKLVGLLSHRDLLAAQVSSQAKLTQGEVRALERSLRVEQVMKSPVHSTRAKTPVAEVAQLMRREGIGCMPVVENGGLVGIITETDFLSLVAEALNDA